MNQIDYSVCPRQVIAKQVIDSLNEDLAIRGDVTSYLIRDKQIITAQIRTNQDMVVCGREWVNITFNLLDTAVLVEWFVQEGDSIPAGTVICKVSGSARPILTGERTALNFMQTLSATASNTRKYVDLVKHTQVQVMDTRKTLPGLRLAQKYAVTVGGGYNQRIGLYDGVLIKENHIMSCGGIMAALTQANLLVPKHIPVQIEIETFVQLTEAIAAGAKNILLDNMTIDQIRECVNHVKGCAILEVSGGVNLGNIVEYANTGVNRISIGDLTKNIQAIDLSLRVINY